MSTTTLTVVEFRDNLLEVLPERPGLAGVQIAGAWLGPDTESRGIYLVDLINGDGPAGRLVPDGLTTGRMPLAETSALPVTCRDWRAGATPQDGGDAFTECFALLAEVIDACQETPAMRGAVDWEDAIDYRSKITPNDVGGWAADVVALFTIRSQVR